MQLGEEYEVRLIDRIYAALFGGGDWNDFLSDLNTGLPGGGSALLFYDANNGNGAIELQNGVPDDWVRDYGAYYVKINPWMHGASRRKVGVGVVAEQMLPRELFVKTEFYNDFYKRIGRESAIGMTIAREHGYSLLLSAFTTSEDADANKVAADRMTRLAPHLQRAVAHFRAAADMSFSDGIGRQVLDRLDIGVVVVGAGGHVHSVSKPAEEMIQEARCVQYTILGNVKLADADADDLLHAMLRAPQDCPRSRVFPLDGIKMTLILAERDRLSRYFAGPTAIIVLERTRPRPLDLEGLKSRFRLTQAELGTLEQLHRGDSAPQIAARNGLSHETVRAHIKSLLQKTGTNRQIDLVRKISAWTREMR